VLEEIFAHRNNLYKILKNKHIFINASIFGEAGEVMETKQICYLDMVTDFKLIFNHGKILVHPLRLNQFEGVPKGGATNL